MYKLCGDKNFLYPGQVLLETETIFDEENEKPLENQEPAIESIFVKQMQKRNPMNAIAQDIDWVAWIYYKDSIL